MSSALHKTLMDVMCMLLLQLLYLLVGWKKNTHDLYILWLDELTLSVTVFLFLRSSMVLWWSLWYVLANVCVYTNLMWTSILLEKTWCENILSAPQSTVLPIGTFCLTPTVVVNASRPSTLWHTTLWQTNILMASPLQSLTTNMQSCTSLTQAIQVWKLFFSV